MTTAPPLINCKYCEHPIDLDEPGWGFNGAREFFHNECCQQFEGINMEDDDADTDF